jgi:hypothetical protein
MVCEQNIRKVEKMMDETSMWVWLGFHKLTKERLWWWREEDRVWVCGNDLSNTLTHEKMFKMFLRRY